MSKWDQPSTSRGVTSSAVSAAAQRAAALRAKLASTGKIAVMPTTIATGITQPATTGVVATPAATLSAEIEINDSPHRAILTRGNTQDELSSSLDVAIVTRGRYMAPAVKAQYLSSAASSLAAIRSGDKPLHLYITAKSEESLTKAKQKIAGILEHGSTNSAATTPNNTYGSLPQQPTSMGYPPPPSMMMGSQAARFIKDKVYISFESLPQPLATDLAALTNRICGPGDQYLKHITQDSSAKIILKGKGAAAGGTSHFREDTFEQLHVHIESRGNPAAVQRAKGLVENLLNTVYIKTDPGGYPGYAPAPAMGNGQYPQHAPYPQHPQHAPYPQHPHATIPMTTITHAPGAGLPPQPPPTPLPAYAYSTAPRAVPPPVPSVPVHLAPVPPVPPVPPMPPVPTTATTTTTTTTTSSSSTTEAPPVPPPPPARRKFQESKFTHRKSRPASPPQVPRQTSGITFTLGTHATQEGI